MNAKIMKINSMRKLVYSTSDILKTAASMPSKPIVYQQAIIKTNNYCTSVGVCVCVRVFICPDIMYNFT